MSVNLNKTSLKQLEYIVGMYVKNAEGSSRNFCRYYYLQDKYTKNPTIVSKSYDDNNNWFFRIGKDRGVVELFWNDEEQGEYYETPENVAKNLWEYIEEVY